MPSPRSLLLALAVSLAALAPEPARAAEIDPFPFPPSLAPAVSFWRDVFTRWDEGQIVFHDARDLGRVYEVRRLPPPDGTRVRERLREELRATWKEAIAADLLRLAEPAVDYDRLEGRLLRYHLIWEGSRDPAVYRHAAESLRAQRGIRERFLAGVSRQARYADAFRAIFREEGVPEELVHLPHVESSYTWNARSSVGAAGMWQFMSATARRYMLVNDAVDERFDPFTGARGAARYLREAHEALGSWPVAITSYNHGVDGMRNAVREMGGSDMAAIIAGYTGPLFGFAGRNFYPEFLAAMQAADSLLEHPGDLDLDEPLPFATFTLPAFVRAPVLARGLGLPVEELIVLNPALTPAATKGERYLPKGFTLRVPVSTGPNAGTLFAAIPESDRPRVEPQVTHRVRRGETLGAIAARFGTSVAALKRLNGISNPNRLRAGALLKLPQ
jgi:membrane-bound lytic murein transglycosylase D